MRGSAADAVTGLPGLTTVAVAVPAPSVTRAAKPMPTASVVQDDDKSAFVLSFTGSEGSCFVLWLGETASVRGPNYSALRFRAQFAACEQAIDPTMPMGKVRFPDNRRLS